ncbi:hypothetical protein O6H91_02G036200 [Diphasiastrum complanatum]|uniref:Uncharacterized protein n=1 Tax=Diphasiastrum complanatum TaxID=34168 RepID=A0ACC2EEB1_DIPCM|nr:hypothetical protein O6H91_02G036200 [Diphasiastrum complanatum]
MRGMMSNASFHVASLHDVLQLMLFHGISYVDNFCFSKTCWFFQSIIVVHQVMKFMIYFVENLDSKYIMKVLISTSILMTILLSTHVLNCSLSTFHNLKLA